MADFSTDPCRERAWERNTPGLGYRADRDPYIYYGRNPVGCRYQRAEILHASAASVKDSIKQRKWRKDTWLVLQV